MLPIMERPEFNQEIEIKSRSVLKDLVEDFLGRPSKRIRSELVTLGFELVDGKNEFLGNRLEIAKEIVEGIHAGSLVVDDIQDGSTSRRGYPSLHQKYGMPLALNAGNWLYFWAIDQISKLGLPPYQEVLAYRFSHDTLVRAHEGQALDLGIKVTELKQSEVAALSYQAMLLKSGALMGLAMKMGALLAGANRVQIDRIGEFGEQLGLVLQMFDDIGNLSSQANPGKRFEDLKNSRPSWIWVVAATELSDSQFSEFVNRVTEFQIGGTHAERNLQDSIESFGLRQLGRTSADAHIEKQLQILEGHFSDSESTIAKIRKIVRRIGESYE